MSELSIHPSGRTESTSGVERQGPVAAAVAMGREALRSSKEIVVFVANTFTAAGEDKNAARYSDKAHSDRAIERHMSAVLNSPAARERRDSRAARAKDWAYGVVGRARIAAHRSPLAAIAMNRTPRHPSEVPGYRKKR